jgi:hypothetical protein
MAQVAERLLRSIRPQVQTPVLKEKKKKNNKKTHQV